MSAHETMERRQAERRVDNSAMVVAHALILRNAILGQTPTIGEVSQAAYDMAEGLAREREKRLKRKK